jgi:hypothetical protein
MPAFSSCGAGACGGPWTNLEALGVKPEMPPELFNRAGVNWRLIFAIADRVGGEWPKRAREAAIEISGVKEAADRSTGVQLLADIKTLLEQRALDKDLDPRFVSSEELLAFLHAMEDGSWAEFGKESKPITSHALARLLKGFGVFSSQIEVKEKGEWVNRKGYIISLFDDPFERYLG